MIEHDKHDSMQGMMWMMAICCGLPLLIVLFGGTLTGPLRWAILALAVGVMIWHFRKMRQGSCHSSPNQTTDPNAAVTAESKTIDHSNH